MPTILLLHSTKLDAWREFEAELAGSELSVVSTPDPAVVERLWGEGAEAILFVASGFTREETLQLCARFSRAQLGPLILCLDAAHQGDTLLELIVHGVSELVVGRPVPGELRARILVAIERHYLERELGRGYGAFRKLFHEAGSPMVMVDHEGRIVDANTSFVRLLGHTQGEARRHDLEALIYEEDRASCGPLIGLARGTPSSYRGTLRLVTKEGGVVWVHLTATRLQDPLTGEARVLADLHDLTPEVESHRALADERSRYEALFEELPVAALVLDLDRMRFTDVNRSAETLFGYTRRELLGRGLSDLWDRDSASPGEVRKLLLGEPRIGPIYQRLRHKNGNAFEAELTLSGFDGQRGATRLVVVRDMTGLRQLESDLERSRQLMSLRSLEATMLGELDTRLKATGEECERVQAAVQQQPGPVLDALSERLRRRCGELRQLVDTYLTNTWRSTNSPEPLDLGEAVRRAEPLVAALVGTGIEVEIEDTDDRLPIWFDPADLEHILVALSTNARDAMDGRGRLTLAAGRISSDEVRGNAFARLSVSDTGPGVPPELRAEIFKPYFTTKPGRADGGLGLATVDRLVRRTGGWVSVDSGPGGGAAFHLDLPLDASRAKSLVREAEVGRRTVLLVDDDEAVLMMVEEMLRQGGLRVLAALGGRQALDAARRYPGQLDLLIVDATLRDMPATRLIRRLDERQPALPVLVISGYLDDVLSTRGQVGRETPFLSKPFTASQLLAAVDSAVVAGAS